MKIPARTLTRNQSIVLVAIGCILILSGIAVLESLKNVSPIIDYVTIEPPSPITVSENGTPVNITVNAYLEKNRFQKIFMPTIDLGYVFHLLGPSTVHRFGPTRENRSHIVLFPTDAGKSIIVIEVGYYAASGFVTVTNVSLEYSINLPINQPPVIASINSSKFTSPVGSIILISVEAYDPDGDNLYYWFKRSPPRSESFYEIPPLRNYAERERFWTPNASEIGDNTIVVEVRDGTESDPYVDRIPVRKDLILSIYDPRNPSLGELP